MLEKSLVMYCLLRPEMQDVAAWECSLNLSAGLWLYFVSSLMSLKGQLSSAA